MLRTACPIALAVLVAAFLWTRSAESATAPTPAEEGVHVVEPMVVFDITGATFAGFVHRHLTVYNNGFVTISKRIDNPFGNLDVDVQTSNVGSTGALKLLLDLVAAGALTLPDQKATAADIPLTTLTVLEGKEIALSRTFSYWGGGPYVGISGVMSDFVSTTFPGF